MSHTAIATSIKLLTPAEYQAVHQRVPQPEPTPRGSTISFPLETIHAITGGEVNLICARYGDGELIDGYLATARETARGAQLTFINIRTGQINSGTFDRIHAGLYWTHTTKSGENQ